MTTATRTDTNLPPASWPEYGPIPIPSDWTDSLLERLDAMECLCVASECICSKANYIRERVSPPMGKNQFANLAKKTGMSLSEAREYYANYQVDVGYAVHAEEFEKLYAEMSEAYDAFHEARRRGEDAWPPMDRYNETVKKIDALRKRIYAPKLNGSV